MGKENKFQKYYDARNEIIEIVQKDLVGPVLEDEILIEAPTQYYTMGKLYPNNNDIDLLDISRTASIETAVDTYDASLASTNMRNPSSMGITCTLKPDVTNVKINIEFAMYEPLDIIDIKKSGLNIDRWSGDYNDETTFWVRRSYSDCVGVNIIEFKEKEIIDGIYIKCYIHKICKGGERIFTAVLINNRKAKNNYITDNANMIFQPHLRIASVDDNHMNIFTASMRQVEIKEDYELLELDLLYSNNFCYGQGHGCSVNWGNYLEDETAEPDYVESIFIPFYELKQMKAAEINENPIFKMKYIYSSQPSEVICNLSKFVDEYDKWITQKESEIDAVEARLQQCAKDHIKNCKHTFERIKYAVELLEKSIKSDKTVWNAFCYTNEAMFMQRCQSLKKQKKPIDEDKITWYPFQLAFILQELPSIIEPEKADRKIVDLLWFPTGGGKTEAYLGIAAFTIFYRRMIHKKNGVGVAVIMRYTLRLLTIQQFERASTLICACELIRKKYSISDESIEIGLWVGNELTPKDVETAKKSLDKKIINAKLSEDEADPCQIKICPWCGQELTPFDYSIDKSKGRMSIKCSNIDCEYHNVESLPIRLLDEEIYKLTPAFIVGTVDKFAQITLKSEPASMFGIGRGNLPPDLIIQDELHLISGPLGTMTGIYEAAIINICQKQGHPVKIIASTATIKNAGNQIKALYGRKYSQFPPQCLSSDDSFFAVKSNKRERPARMYLGLMGVGTTFTTTLIRVYAAWLFSSRYLIALGYEDKIIDNFWTLTGYFNSLRELGGTRTQVVDDVQSRYQYLKDRKFAHLVPQFNGKEHYDYSEELTSRMGNDQISEIIQKGLKKGYTKESTSDVYDFILASNMISVGVDVGRLGTMAVAGQPKTNAEYIQATSRVGRDNPGLVFMVYNQSRSRDRSHYEQFLKYHSAMYRYVEATSMTPFSDRARDRGLQALFITMCRYLINDLLENESAGNFRENDRRVLEIEKQIKEYVQIVDEQELNNVIEELQDIKEQWQEKTGGELYYKKLNKNSLLKPDTAEDDRFRTMNSMRSVEQQSGIYLLGG